MLLLARSLLVLFALFATFAHAAPVPLAGDALRQHNGTAQVALQVDAADLDAPLLVGAAVVRSTGGKQGSSSEAGETSSAAQVARPVVRWVSCDAQRSGWDADSPAFQIVDRAAAAADASLTVPGVAAPGATMRHASGSTGTRGAGSLAPASAPTHPTPTTTEYFRYSGAFVAAHTESAMVADSAAHGTPDAGAAAAEQDDAAAVVVADERRRGIDHDQAHDTQVGLPPDTGDRSMMSADKKRPHGPKDSTRQSGKTSGTKVGRRGTSAVARCSD